MQPALLNHGSATWKNAQFGIDGGNLTDGEQSPGGRVQAAVGERFCKYVFRASLSK
jgi:hypothetical protein